MNCKHEDANSLVQFSLTFPVFLMISWALVDVVLLQIRYVVMAAHAREAVRLLAVSSLQTEVEMECAVRDWFIPKAVKPDSVTIAFASLRPPNHFLAERKKKDVRIIKMVLDGGFETTIPFVNLRGLGRRINWRIHERAVQII